MKSRLIMHFLLLCAVFSTQLYAAKISPLYSIDIDVKDQTFTERKAAIREAFDQTVLRLTGSNAALELPSIVGAHKKASQWVAQFSYRQGEVIDDATESNVLRIDFDSEAINQLLFDAGYETWQVPRPMTAVALEFYGFEALGFAEDSFFVEEQRQQWAAFITEMSNRYALPVVLAEWSEVADTEMSMSVVAPSQDLVFAEEDAAVAVVENSIVLTQYDAPSVLLGRLSLDRQGQWQTRWQHYLYGDMVGLFEQGVAADIVDRLGLQLTGRLRGHYFSYRIIKEEKQVLLTVRGIVQLIDFQEVKATLNELEHIVSMRVSLIHGDEVVYELEVKGGPVQLQEDLEMSERLQAVDRLPLPEQGQFDHGNIQIPQGLIYQWGA